MDTTEKQEADNAWALLDAQALQLDSDLSPPVNEIESVNEPQEIETAELLAPVIKITADLIAPNWALTESECEQLGGAYGALLDKYLPENGLNNYGVEIAAILTTGIIFSARKGVPMRKKEPENEPEKPVNEKPQVVKNETKNGVLMPKAVIDG